MARATDFIPPDMKDQVIGASGLAGPGETVEVTFKDPAAAGSYPFICTFPGHFAAGMRGTITREVTINREGHEAREDREDTLGCLLRDLRELRVSRDASSSLSDFTVNVARPIFPRLLNAQHVTVVLPTLKVPPDAGVQLTGREPSMLSLAVAVNVAAAPPDEDAATVTSPDVVTAGGVGSSAPAAGDRCSPGSRTR